MTRSVPMPANVQRVFQSRAETRAFYDKISHVYDLLSDHSEAPVRAAALELLAAQPGEEILEIGFGTGHSLVTIAKAVSTTGKVYGIDLSDKMVELAEKNLRRTRLRKRAELICGDATKLPWLARRFDGILMSFTLELFDTPEIPKVLAECKRALKPAGRLVVAGMSKEGASGPIVKAYEWTHRHFPNFVDCRPMYVRRSIAAAGFAVEKTSQMQMWVPVEIVRAVKSSG